MTASLILTCLWFVAANIGAILPSRRGHWPLAWGLIATGIPILGFVCLQHGPWIALLIMAKRQIPRIIGLDQLLGLDFRAECTVHDQDALACLFQ